MQNKKHSTDGFVLRRRQNTGAERPRITLDAQTPNNLPERFLIDPTKPLPVRDDASAPMMTRNNLDRQAASLTAGDGDLNLPETTTPEFADVQAKEGGRHKWRRARRDKKMADGGKKWPLRRIIKWSSIGLGIALVVFIGYFGYKLIATSGAIFKGNPIAALFNQGKELQMDKNGHTNVLLFGTSEDDPGHPGANLTDSIMVASIDQKAKTGFVISIARDFYVDYGQACPAGYRGKINSLYMCVKDKSNEEAGAKALSKKVGQILGLDIQYYVHVNYSVLRESVDAVGGITVNIESTDPRGILDRNFDWICRYNCYMVKYPNGPVKLDGAHALALARARGDVAPTYGLSRSNPDRQDNQRKILLALKDKAASAGVLSNPVAVNKLLDTFGKNLRTNFDAEEVKTLMKLGQDIKSSDIASASMEDPDYPLATVSCWGGNVCPNAGTHNYNEIHRVVKLFVKGDTFALENATVTILNASGTPGQATAKAAELRKAGFNVARVGNAATKLGTEPIKFYDLSKGKNPQTLKKLQSLLGVNVTSGKPSGVSSSADFVIIIGKQPDQQ